MEPEPKDTMASMGMEDPSAVQTQLSTQMTSLSAEAVIADAKKPIPNKYILRLGRFIFRWNRIDALAERVIWTLARIDPDTGRIFTSTQLKLRFRVQWISELLSLVCALIERKFDTIYAKGTT